MSAGRHLPAGATLCMLLFLCSAAGRADAGSTYSDANDAYLGGDHAEAVRLYESLAAAGIRHEHLFYNLGNAYFRLGEPGFAVYNYERALWLAPDFDDARHNLAVARNTAAAAAGVALEAKDRAPVWRRLITGTSTTDLMAAVLLADALFFLALIAHHRAWTPRIRVRAAIAVTGLAFAMSASLLVAHIRYLEADNIGIVLPATVELHEAGDESSATHARAHAAMRVHVLASEPGWLEVRLPSGIEGWVPGHTVGRFRAQP